MALWWAFNYVFYSNIYQFNFHVSEIRAHTVTYLQSTKVRVKWGAKIMILDFVPGNCTKMRTKFQIWKVRAIATPLYPNLSIQYSLLIMKIENVRARASGISRRDRPTTESNYHHNIQVS